MNTKCLFVSLTGAQPFKRCQYCEKSVQDCFGLQFFVISASIIVLLITTLFITDIPILVLDVMIAVILLIALLSFLASKETNEIVLNNVFLAQLNRDLEEKVGQRTEELTKSNEDLVKINQMKNEFIGIINHELKTPITSVISGIEIIRAHGTKKFDASQNKLIDIMEKSGQDMLHLTNNLLDLSKIESGKIEIYPDHFPLISMVEEVVQALKPEADRKKIAVEANIDKKISTVYADPDRLKQVLFNLIDNAIKYTKENGSVNINAQGINGAVKVEVKDNGVGIKKEHLDKLFNKFAKHLPGYRGTGLGLYITKSFIEAHKGIMEVESEQGKGATFSFTIPKVQTA
ncbi:sensor histidine kinase [Candidatus Margulisiibacteriota bacterium]